MEGFTMRVFVTGASGWIGSAVTDELLAHGYDVTGLARSDRSAAALETKGVAPLRGSLDNPAGLAAAAAAADAVVHLAFIHDFANYAAAGHSEHAAVKAMLDALEGSGRPFLLASGLASDVTGRPLTEDDPSPHHGADSMRGGSENLALSYADRDVRTVALRFSPTVHGMGDHGFTAALANIALEKGVAGYIGDGSTHWTAVHRSDAARMVRLAMEKAPAGTRVHGVAEEAIKSRAIAQALGDYLNLPVASIATADAASHFGWLGGFFGADITASSKRTRELLDWSPTGPTLLEDIAAGAYGTHRPAHSSASSS
jgi:nucleoside-diphosphate-sugar epimerase